jgi:hypothetical protein
VTAAIILWNTEYLDNEIETLRQPGLLPLPLIVTFHRAAAATRACNSDPYSASRLINGDVSSSADRKRPFEVLVERGVRGCSGGTS